MPPPSAADSASPVVSNSMRSAKMAHHPPPKASGRALEQLSAHSNPIGFLASVSAQHRWTTAAIASSSNASAPEMTISAHDGSSATASLASTAPKRSEEHTSELQSLM